jgi:hypothetical protein
MPIPVSDEELRGYFSQVLRQRDQGYQVNLETAIIKRACLAFRRGETRGPALSDEYTVSIPDGNGGQRNVVRQDFTAGIAEFDPATGQVNWVEIVTHPESIVAR